MMDNGEVKVRQQSWDHAKTDTAKREDKDSKSDKM